jgi:hypothetical protein
MGSTDTYIPEIENVDLLNAEVTVTVRLVYIDWETLPTTVSFFLMALRDEFPALENDITFDQTMDAKWLQSNLDKYIEYVDILSEENNFKQDVDYTDWKNPVGRYLVKFTDKKWIENQNQTSSWGLNSTCFDVCPPAIGRRYKPEDIGIYDRLYTSKPATVYVDCIIGTDENSKKRKNEDETGSKKTRKLE